jgi:hypothetical protein
MPVVQTCLLKLHPLLQNYFDSAQQRGNKKGRSMFLRTAFLLNLKYNIQNNTKALQPAVLCY